MWEDQKMIQGVDFASSFLVILFREEEPSTGYEVLTHSVILLNDHRIIINSEFREPTPGEASDQVVVHPYEIIKIPKEGLNGEYQFILTNNGFIMAEEIHEIK